MLFLLFTSLFFFSDQKRRKRLKQMCFQQHFKAGRGQVLKKYRTTNVTSNALQGMDIVLRTLQ